MTNHRKRVVESKTEVCTKRIYRMPAPCLSSCTGPPEITSRLSSLSICKIEQTDDFETTFLWIFLLWLQLLSLTTGVIIFVYITWRLWSTLLFFICFGFFLFAIEGIHWIAVVPIFIFVDSRCNITDEQILTFRRYFVVFRSFFFFPF